jgi:hypothetical protein
MSRNGPLLLCTFALTETRIPAETFPGTGRASGPPDSERLGWR